MSMYYMILSDEALIYRLLSYTLVGIRAAAYEGNNKIAFKLADLIDNVPGQLGHIGESFLTTTLYLLVFGLDQN